jgi:hypothetical protein
MVRNDTMRTASDAIQYIRQTPHNATRYDTTRYAVRTVFPRGVIGSYFKSLRHKPRSHPDQDTIRSETYLWNLLYVEFHPTNIHRSERVLKKCMKAFWINLAHPFLTTDICLSKNCLCFEIFFGVGCS